MILSPSYRTTVFRIDTILYDYTVRYTSGFRNVPLPGSAAVLGETPCPGGAHASPSARCRPAVERKAELSARRPAPLGDCAQFTDKFHENYFSSIIHIDSRLE